MSRFAAIVAIALAATAGCREPRRPNVVLIVIDALRKDALHVYGNALPVSPAIDALAASGALFENHLSHAAQTVPAMLSVLLSRLPADHGFSPPNPGILALQRPRYPDDFVFLQEVFQDAGYATAGFTANPYLTAKNGFDQGFDTLISIEGPGEELNSAAFAWFAQQATSRPFFLYVHYMDVHQPYRPPARHAARFVAANGGSLLDSNREVPDADPRDLAYSHATYEACVAHADELVAALLQHLDDTGLRDDTLVVLTADHGEEFGEHGGIGHGRSIYGEVVRVPLLMAWPGRIEPGRRIGHLSQHLDLAPTILALAGVDVPPSFRGQSVFEPAQHVILEMARWRGIAGGSHKWIWNQTTGAQELYALSDEGDRAPLDEPAVAAQLRAQLDSYLASSARPADRDAARVGTQWSKQEQERLRALGYAR